jgi:hypothetical protein
MRLAALLERRKNFRRAIVDALGHEAHPDVERLEAVAHLLYSAAAWETLKDYCGMNGREAGLTVSWALETLLGPLRQPGATDTTPKEENLS